jgi:hypothetical protein
MTPLDKTLKRALSINGTDYVVTLTPDALKLTRKGKRLGMELKWADITSGESALAVALHASVGRFEPDEKSTPAVKSAPPKVSRSARGSPTKRSRRTSR